MTIVDEKTWWTASSQVTIEDNGLTAYLTIQAEPGPGINLTIDGLIDYLKQSNVVYGIDFDACSNVIRSVQEVIGRKVALARGIPPVPGVDARIELHFNSHQREFKPKILENGNVDFYDRGEIQAVQVGQLLASKKPLIQGQNGMSVRGTGIPPRPARDVRLPIGKGVVANEEGTALYAAVEGHLVYQPRDNKLNVFQVYEVKSDVDFSTGNIEFIGSVTIYGNVQPGFKIIAAGDVEVYGYVDAAQIEAGGNITIRGGVQGRNKGVIRSGGTLQSLFIQSAVVEAVQDVVVQESIMHSHVTAGQNVTVAGKRAVIVGGLISAGREVRTKVLGSPMATPTEVEVGVHPQLRAEINQIHEALNALRTNIDKTQKALALLQNMAGAKNQLSPDKAAIYENLEKTLTHYRIEEEQHMERKLQIESTLKEVAESRIIASEMAHSGLKLTIGQAVTYIRDDYPKAVYVLENGEIRLSRL